MENQNEDRPTFSENYEKKIVEIVRKYYNEADAALILQGRKQAKDELKHGGKREIHDIICSGKMK